MSVPPGAGYALETYEFDRLKAALRQASESLGLRDFSDRAGLAGGLTVQSVSPHENVAEAVDEVILALTRFVDRDYPAVTSAFQSAIDRVHLALETALDTVHATQIAYDEAERIARESIEDAARPERGGG